MRIFIDIDGTIAFCNGPVVCMLCNDKWSLGITEERMELVEWITDFQAMPEVQARCEERGQERFNYELGWMKFHPEAILADIVATGSQEAISKLAQLGMIAYCTARYSESEEWHQPIVESTHRWLEKHQFPNANDVIFCNRIEGKLHYLLAQARETDEHLVLIDDSYPRILELVGQMSSADRELLCRKLTLVAFASTSPPIGDLYTLSLRRWRDIDLVISSLEQGGHNATTL